MKIAEVHVDLALQEIDRVFHYTFPADLEVEIGQAVRVPFGRRQVTGIVVGFVAESPHESLKDIAEILFGGETMITAEQLLLARKLADYYLCPVSLILRQMLPFRLDSNLWPRPKLEKAAVARVNEMPPSLSKRAVKQREILQSLITHGQMPYGAFASGPLKELIAKGYVEVITKEAEAPGGFELKEKPTEAPLTLTEEQAAAMNELKEDLIRQNPETWLLHGVTGSGKTEIYLQLIAAALELGKQSLVLVPEISLTPQMVARFSARFGDKIALWHSGLSPRQRLDTWRRIKSGRAPIVIGARSAIFAPLMSIGVIILDEEHDQSYQQDENPRYHTRVVAQLRQRIGRSLLLLGSATPSLETYFASERGRCRRLELKARVSSRVLPPVRVVDMRQELRSGHKAPISRRLEYALSECLDKKEQAIILLNRRGFANFLLCLDCGHVPFCPYCDISLTYHLSTGNLHCHYCGFQQSVPAICPQCGGERLKTQGFGTERLEKYLKEQFPEARIRRMDRDTTTARDAHATILEAFGQGRYDILVGTQMIAKGLDFPRVTLVGVVGADNGLYIPDFRSAERTFQLLTQVSGRAGRGEAGGEVVLQAFNVGHYALECARGHDYIGFFQKELHVRQQGGYPPLGYMIIAYLTSKDEGRLIEDAAFLAAKFTEALGPFGNLVGPTPCVISRIKNSYRWQIIVKSQHRQRLRQAAAEALGEYYREKRETLVILEFDA